MPAGTEADRLGAPRWKGQRGRIEVWYATFSDAEGTGYWVHHELVAPTANVAAFGRGWAAVFPGDAAPTLARFDSDTVTLGDAGCWFGAGRAQIGPGRLVGAAGELEWDLVFADDSPPLYTFPKVVWERELLPGSQVVPWPHARLCGTVSVAGQERAVDAQGAIARIYGHANPQRWCWLHACLDHVGVIEAVCAVARRPGLRRLPPAAMVRVRLDGEDDWPPRAALAALRLRTRIEPGGFTVSGSVAGRHLRLAVNLPPERCVAVTYRDPDGATATCTNTERADAEISLADINSARMRRWELTATAHAEIGTRP